MEVVEGWDAAGAGAADGAGTFLVYEPARAETGGVVLYARVSSSDERDDLERQVGRLAAWATQQGLGVTGTVAEAGSGLNGSRAKLKRLRADPAVGTVVVEHRERLSSASSSGNAALIRVQRSRWTTAHSVQFTINLAVASKVVWDWQPAREPGRGRFTIRWGSRGSRRSRGCGCRRRAMRSRPTRCCR